MRPFVLLILAAALGGGGACNNMDIEPPEVSPVNAKEAESFVRDIASALDPCDPDRLDAVIDLDALGRIILNGLDVPRSARKGFLEGFTRNKKMGALLCDAGENINKYHFLRMRGDGKDAGTRPLYRITAANGINYIELQLGRSHRDGKVRIIDAYTFMNGERLSDTQRGVVRALFSGGSLTWVKQLQEIYSLSAAGDNARAHELIGKLPSEVRRTRGLMLVDIKVTAALDEGEYLAAISAYEKAFPGDPSVDLVSIDGHFLRKDYDRAIAAMDRLDRGVGGDPYLSSMRSIAYLQSGKLDLALQQAITYSTAEPAEESGWWSLLSVRLTRDEIDEALGVMEQLHERFDLRFDPAAMAAEEGYARLLASPKWKQWQQAHPQAIQTQADGADDSDAAE